MSEQIPFKVLIISPTPTWPLNFGNRKRIFSICEQLKKNGMYLHFVHYASEADWRGGYPLEYAEKMRNQWDVVDHIFPSKPIHDAPQNGLDHEVDEWWDWVIQHHIEQLTKRTHFNLCIVNYTWLSKALEFVPEPVFKVLDTHDKFSGRRELLERNGLEKEFFHTTTTGEKLGLDRADLVWAIKEQERNDFISMGVLTEVRTLVHLDVGVDEIEPRSDFDFLKVGIIGAANNINKYNFESFYHNAIKVFSEFIPALKVYIAGSVCSELDILENEYFEFCGYVEKLDEFYADVDVLVIPMAFSTGLKIKVAEAISFGKPFLSHLHASEGFDLVDDCHKLQSFEAMALELTRIAYDPDRLSAMREESLIAKKNVAVRIEEEIQYIVSQLTKRCHAVVVVPKQYGDKSSVLHWLAEERLEYVRLQYSDYLVFRCCDIISSNGHSVDVKNISKDQLANTIRLVDPCIVINLDEFLNLDKFDFKCRYLGFSAGCTDKRDHVLSDFYSTEAESYHPLFGLVWPSFLQKLIDRERKHVLVLGPITPVVKFYSELIIPGEEVGHLELPTFLALDHYLKKLIALPKLVIVAEDGNKLSDVERFILVMCLTCSVKVAALNRPIELFDSPVTLEDREFDLREFSLSKLAQPEKMML
ncbi:glycosyltransferase [Halioxenophilus aromaticivorans]|uniref:Glycosyltransferase n=1 Tax=Halioxenophilus aromaticivorans TaxID=1306992 RepID=A0AAV3TZT3_9ALTE